MNAEILVVGAGPAGASAAWHLAQLGVDVMLIDRARFPREKVCAEYLSPQASRLLSAMGALRALETAGAAHLTGMTVRAPNGREIVGQFAGAHGFHGFQDQGLAIPRVVLDATLVGCAQRAGVRLIEGVRVVDLVYDANGQVTGVTALDTSGATRTLRASLVIGADGLRSVVARRLRLVRRAWWPRRIALVAHYRDLPDVGGVGEMHVERTGYVGIADVGGGVSNVALVVPTNRARGISGDPAEFLEQWLMNVPHLAARFARATRASPVRVTGPFAVSTRRAWGPGAALVGDAADFFDPFTGEGIYSALRGGELLAPFAAGVVRTSHVDARAAALAEYDRARRREFADKWKVEWLIGLFVATPWLMNHAARALSRRADMADLLIGVAGDFVPARQVLRPGYLARLLVFGV